MAHKSTDEGLEQRVEALKKGTIESKRAKEVLRESEKRYRDLYENAPSGYFTISGSNGSILRCNAAAPRLLGYDRETMMRMKVFDVYADTPHGESKAKEVFKRFKAGGSIRDVELQMKHRDGRPIWISLSAEPVRDRDGKITESDLPYNLRGTVSRTEADITSLRATEKNLILKVLQEVRGNKYQAAKKLGITRSTLYGKMRKHGVATLESE